MLATNSKKYYEHVECRGDAVAAYFRGYLAGNGISFKLVASKTGFNDYTSMLYVFNDINNLKKIYSSCANCSIFAKINKNIGYVGKMTIEIRRGLWGSTISVAGDGFSGLFALGRTTAVPPVQMYVKSIVGRRKNNEDSGLTGTVCAQGEKFRIMAVADGAGGLGGGDVASTVGILVSMLSIVGRLYGGDRDFLGIIDNSINIADKYLLNYINYYKRRMASTLAIVIYDNNKRKIYYGSVGDSAIILYKNDFVILNELQRIEHDGRSMLVSYLGGAAEASVGEENVEPGDLVLVSSDGGYEYFVNQKLNIDIGFPEIIDYLVSKSYELGSSDNITVAGLYLGR